MFTSWQEIKSRFNKVVWDTDLNTLPLIKARLIKFVRIFYAVLKDLSRGQLTLWAMSMVYSTLLSMVPVLALSFSVLRAFGVHNQIEPLLLRLLQPMGEKGVEIANRIIEFVESVNVGVLGAAGLAFLIYTVISLTQKVEDSFNEIWHIPRSRTFAERFSHYLSVILIGPVLVFSALGLTATVMGTSVVQEAVTVEPIGRIVEIIGALMPYILIIGAFSFLYVFLPNTQVHLHAAFAGGVVAGILWQTVGWGFTTFVVTSTKYSAIYSSFAILILFLIWLYLSWLILLVGTDIAFYTQQPEFLSPKKQSPQLSNRLKERLALLIMLRVGSNFYHHRPVLNADSLSHNLEVPSLLILPIVNVLRDKGLLVETADNTSGYIPGADMETISIKNILDAVRDDKDGNFKTTSDKIVDDLIQQYDQAISGIFEKRNLKELVVSQ